MKRLCLSIALLVIALSGGTASAQWGSGWCQTCYVASHVDVPASDGAPYPGYLAGWAFQCQNGAPITRADVYYTDASAPNGQVRVTDAQLSLGGARPDVQAYFVNSGTCPNAPPDSGWAIGFPTPIPPGTRTLTVTLWYFQVYGGHTRTVTIP